MGHEGEEEKKNNWGQYGPIRSDTNCPSTNIKYCCIKSNERLVSLGRQLFSNVNILDKISSGISNFTDKLSPILSVT
jgi:hypothetical protein